MLLGLITLISALFISCIGAFFSITGMAEIFNYTFWPVVIMMGALEAGKIVSALWLHRNWSNPKVSFLHKAYLSAAIIILMLITSMGIFGFLSKGHLDQLAPSASITVQLDAIETQINSNNDQVKRYQIELNQLDKQIDVLLNNDRATQSNTMRAQQKNERDQISQGITSLTKNNDELNKKKFELKENLSTTEIKLGPIKYVAELIFSNPSENIDSAVRVVILMIIFAFDPLAVLLVISSSITFADYFEKKYQKQDKSLAIKSIQNSNFLELQEYIKKLDKRISKPNNDLEEFKLIRDDIEEKLKNFKAIELNIDSNMHELDEFIEKINKMANGKEIGSEENQPLEATKLENISEEPVVDTNKEIQTDLPIKLRYDSRIDTLYIGRGFDLIGYTEQQTNGLLFKKDQISYRPVGVIAPFYSILWQDKLDELISQVEGFLKEDMSEIGKEINEIKIGNTSKEHKDRALQYLVYAGKFNSELKIQDKK